MSYPAGRRRRRRGRRPGVRQRPRAGPLRGAARRPRRRRTSGCASTPRASSGSRTSSRSSCPRTTRSCRSWPPRTGASSASPRRSASTPPGATPATSPASPAPPPWSTAPASPARPTPPPSTTSPSASSTAPASWPSSSTSALRAEVVARGASAAPPAASVVLVGRPEPGGGRLKARQRPRTAPPGAAVGQDDAQRLVWVLDEQVEPPRLARSTGKRWVRSGAARTRPVARRWSNASRLLLPSSGRSVPGSRCPAGSTPGRGSRAPAVDEAHVDLFDGRAGLGLGAGEVGQATPDEQDDAAGAHGRTARWLSSLVPLITQTQTWSAPGPRCAAHLGHEIALSRRPRRPRCRTLARLLQPQRQQV